MNISGYKFIANSSSGEADLIAIILFFGMASMTIHSCIGMASKAPLYFIGMAILYFIGMAILAFIGKASSESESENLAIIIFFFGMAFLAILSFIGMASSEHESESEKLAIL